MRPLHVAATGELKLNECGKKLLYGPEKSPCTLYEDDRIDQIRVLGDCISASASVALSLSVTKHRLTDTFEQRHTRVAKRPPPQARSRH
jgi:hypothetical protein